MTLISTANPLGTEREGALLGSRRRACASAAGRCRRRPARRAATRAVWYGYGGASGRPLQSFCGRKVDDRLWRRQLRQHPDSTLWPRCLSCLKRIKQMVLGIRAVREARSAAEASDEADDKCSS